MASRAPIGYLAIGEVLTAINQVMIAIMCMGGLSSRYALQWARTSMEIIKGRANGTTVQEIRKTSFRPIPALLPPPEALKVFAASTDLWHERLVANLCENRMLATIGDALLPRLRSGEIRISDAERMAGAVL